MRSSSMMLMWPLALLLGCSSVPSYEGGPTREQPYAIVSPGERVSLWRIDRKNAWNRLGDTYLSPGAHTLKFRVEYSVEHEGIGNFEWKELSEDFEEGVRYLVSAKPDGFSGEVKLDLPPYRLVVEKVPIRGYVRR